MRRGTECSSDRAVLEASVSEVARAPCLARHLEASIPSSQKQLRAKKQKKSHAYTHLSLFLRYSLKRLLVNSFFKSAFLQENSLK